MGEQLLHLHLKEAAVLHSDTLLFWCHHVSPKMYRWYMFTSDLCKVCEWV